MQSRHNSEPCMDCFCHAMLCWQLQLIHTFSLTCRLWRPQEEQSMHVSSSADAAGQIWCGQGPPPPNPMVVERFSQVISQLFQQVGDLHP